LAVAAVATLMRAAMVPLVGDELPFIVHLPAVALAAWLGGVEGGVCATIGSVFLVDYLFFPDQLSPAVHDPHHAAGLALFVVVALALVWQVRRWRRAERGLRVAIEDLQRVDAVRQRYEVLVRQGRDIILFVRRPDGQVLEANEAAARAYGCWREELCGLNIRDLRAPNTASLTEAQMAQADSGGLLFETAHRRRDGSLFPVEVSSLGTTIDGERVLLSIVRDVTERKRQEQALRDSEARYRKLYREAEQANQVKDDFLATLSHELRTPLNAILGWSHMLATGAVAGPTQRQAIEVILRNAEAEKRLVEEVLDLSRIVSGRFRLDLREIDARGFIERALDAIAPAAEAKRLAVTTSLGKPVGMVGDADRLQQVMWNLLSNAVKFTPQGGRVAVSATRDQSQVQIEVSDSGIGIEDAFLPRVFDRFTQADSSSTRRYGGLGLGLSIVRHIVELHGGTVMASSGGAGQGTTFRISLPIRASVQPGTAVEVMPAAGGRVDSDLQPRSLAGVRVLAIEDDEDSRHVLQTMLTTCGASAVVCASVREAMRVFVECRPDVVVSDIGMPDEDGYAFVRALRGLPADEGGQTPAVALTAYNRASDQAEILRAGYDEYLPKPTTVLDLAQAIARATRALRP
jgi:PAS domain S-box-containing protein